MSSLPTFQESGFSSPTLYLRSVLKSYSLADVLGPAFSGQINLPERDSQLGLRKDTLVNFFTKKENFSQEFQDWRSSPVIQQSRKKNATQAGRKTSLEKYGVDNPSKSSGVIQKIKATNLTRYGTETPKSLPQFIQKGKDTNLKKYGVEHPSGLPEIREKVRGVMLSKYGVSSPAQSPQIQAKIRQTNLGRYGVPVVTQSHRVRDKVKKTNLKRYGVSCSFQIPTVIQASQEALFARWRDRLGGNFLDWKSVLGPDFLSYKVSITHRAQQLGVNYSDLIRFYRGHCPDFNDFIDSDSYQTAFCGTSTLELSLESKFRSWMPFMSYSLSSQKEIDLYFPEQHVGFEFNGFNWHSARYGKTPDYHKEKTSEALSQGIKLYHLWYQEISVDIFEKFGFFINSRLGIFDVTLSAGSTSCRTLTTGEARNFHKSFHLHGSPIMTGPGYYSWGLYHHSVLVSVMTWRVQGYISDNTRYTVRPGYQIKFGFQKLMMKAVIFLKSLGVTQLVSYCDRDLSPDPDSTVYSRYGFVLANRDNYPLHLSYYATRKVGAVSAGHHSRQTFMKHRLSSLGIILQEGETADSALARHGVFPCYNSGTWKYIYTLN